MSQACLTLRTKPPPQNPVKRVASFQMEEKVIRIVVSRRVSNQLDFEWELKIPMFVSVNNGVSNFFSIFGFIGRFGMVRAKSQQVVGMTRERNPDAC